MQWLLSLKLVVLLTVANGIPAVAWRVFGEYFNRPLDGGVAFFDRQPIFGISLREVQFFQRIGNLDRKKSLPLKKLLPLWSETHFWPWRPKAVEFCL